MRATEALALYNGEVTDEKSQIHYLSESEIKEIKKLRRKKPKSKTDQTFLDFFQPEVDKKLAISAMFDKFWEAYPRKKSKIYARKCFVRAIKKVSLEKILSAIAEQKKSTDWTEQKGKYVPHPSSWLNQGCWDDEVEHKETIAEKHARLKEKGEI